MNRNLLLLLYSILLSSLPLWAKPVTGSDWPQYRGINRDGVSTESGLLETWPEAGPAERWRVKIGPGFSGIVISQGQLLTMLADGEAEDRMEYAAAFDPKTGKELWRTVVGKEFINEFGNGPRSTPVVDGDMVYFLSSNGTLAALKTADGQKVWSLDFVKTFESNVPRFGYSTSPLVVDDLLITEPGGGDGEALAALDKKTGKLVWKKYDGNSTYNSPILVTLHGTRQIIFARGEKLMSLDSKGEENWSFTWGEGVRPIAMPIFVSPDRFFVSASGQGGAVLLKANQAGSETKISELWRASNLRNHFNSSVIREGYLYGFDNATLKCYSLEKGEQAWAKRGFGKGSLMLADDHLVLMSDQGKLVWIKATPEAYVEEGNFQAIKGKSWTAPTVSHGHLYVRNLEEMVCFVLKK